MKKTSIIILSYNTREYTQACIESIRRFTPAGSYEIIVVDNASQDDSVTWLQAQNDLKLILNTENKGFPVGCNQGMAIAEAGNDLLLLNSDTIVTPRWLENMQRALHSDDGVGAVGCVTNYSCNGQNIDIPFEIKDIADFDSKLKDYSKLHAQDPSIIINGVLEAYKGGEKVGYVIDATSPNGYGGDVQVALGITNEGEITAFTVISAANETPGLGAKSTEPEFQEQFSGLSEIGRAHV